MSQENTRDDAEPKEEREEGEEGKEVKDKNENEDEKDQEQPTRSTDSSNNEGQIAVVEEQENTKERPATSSYTVSPRRVFVSPLAKSSLVQKQRAMELEEPHHVRLRKHREERVKKLREQRNRKEQIREKSDKQLSESITNRLEKLEQTTYDERRRLERVEEDRASRSASLRSFLEDTRRAHSAHVARERGTGAEAVQEICERLNVTLLPHLSPSPTRDRSTSPNGKSSPPKTMKERLTPLIKNAPEDERRSEAQKREEHRIKCYEKRKKNTEQQSAEMIEERVRREEAVKERLKLLLDKAMNREKEKQHKAQKAQEHVDMVQRRRRNPLRFMAIQRLEERERAARHREENESSNAASPNEPTSAEPDTAPDP